MPHDDGPSISQISIKKLDLSKMPIDCKVLMLGAPASGKSTLITDILFQHRKRFTAAIAMSGSEEANGFYRGMIPDIFIYDGYREDVVEKLRIRQMRLVRKNGKEHRDNHAVLIADDCMDNKDWIRSDLTRWLFKNGRHYDIFFLLAAQYAMDLTPELRASLDYVFIMKQAILKDKKKIYENFAGIFPTFQMFCDVLDNLTEDYHCMVLSNRSKSNKIEDRVFWYKADLHEKGFRVGTPGLWRFHDHNYNDMYMEEEEAERLKQATKGRYQNRKKNATLFIVNKVD